VVTYDFLEEKSKNRRCLVTHVGNWVPTILGTRIEKIVDVNSNYNSEGVVENMVTAFGNQDSHN